MNVPRVMAHMLADVIGVVVHDIGCNDVTLPAPIMSLDIASLGRRSFRCQNAWAEVLTAIKKSGEIPQSTSRATVKRRRDAQVNVDTPHGAWSSPLQMVASWFFPTATQALFCTTCPHLQALVKPAFDQRSGTLAELFTIMVYLDEISPTKEKYGLFATPLKKLAVPS